MSSVIKYPKLAFDNPNNILNAVGIQPIFADAGYVERSCISFLRRDKSKWIPNGKYVWSNKIRVGTENREILDNLIPVEEIRMWVARRMLSRSLQFSLPYEPEEIVQTDKFTKTVEQCYLKGKYYTHLFWGNTFLTNNKVIYENIKRSCREMQILRKIILPDFYLPANSMICDCVGKSAWDNPIVVCPIIERDHFLWWCDAKGYSPVPPRNPKFYPLIARMNYRYTLYKEYMQEFPPKHWHIEEFDKCTKYYTTFFFRRDRDNISFPPVPRGISVL